MCDEARRQFPSCEKEPRIVLYRFDSLSVASVGDGEESNNNNHSRDKNNRNTSIHHRKYRRINCGLCKGCTSGDCLECGVCLGKQTKRRCLRKICRRPLLSQKARCSICGARACTVIDVSPFPPSHRRLAECGLCNKVVHPACLIRKYNLTVDVDCVFYTRYLNAWDCILCNIGLSVESRLESSSSSSSNKNIDSATEGQRRVVIEPPIESPLTPTVATEEESLSSSCLGCARSDPRDSLMTCTGCARTEHDVCIYAKNRGDPRFVAGVRNCLDPKFWECPACLRSRGVRADSWVETGIFHDTTTRSTAQLWVENSMNMFAPEVGNIVVSHLKAHQDVVDDDVEPPTILDDLDDSFVEEPGGGGAAAAAAPAVVAVAFKCDVCSSDFSSEEALRFHVTSQHPMCGHCPQPVYFQDIPKILSHFKAVHKKLKRCKVLIANETLTLAMNTSFHG